MQACDKIFKDVSPWKEPKTRRDDVVVGIYSGESLLHSRGAAVRDTWLASMPNVRMYTPTTVAGFSKGFEERGMVPDFLDAHGAQVAQLYGLRDMYRTFPDKKWYYIVGCDTYVQMDYALRVLDNLDAAKPWWVTRFAYPTKPFEEHWEVNTSLFPNYQVCRSHRTHAHLHACAKSTHTHTHTCSAG